MRKVLLKQNINFKRRMASCYGDESGGENKECSGLLGQELVKQVLPIEWKIERQDNFI